MADFESRLKTMLLDEKQQSQFFEILRVKHQGLNLTKISSKKDFKMPQLLGLIFIFFRGRFFVSRRETRKRAFPTAVGK